MNTEISNMMDNLDYGNRNLVELLIKSLFAMQSHSQREFQKIMPVNMIKNPMRTAVIHRQNAIMQLETIHQLDLYQKKTDDEFGYMFDSIERDHNSNAAAIECNLAVKASIKELMEYIGVRENYETHEYKANKVKTTKHTAGYISDLQHFCVTNDRYSTIKSALESDFSMVNNAIAEKRKLINIKLEHEKQTNLFYAFNKIALKCGIAVHDYNDFIQVKSKMLHDVDSSLGSLYDSKIKIMFADDEYELSEPDVANQILFNNTTLIQDELKDILCLRYDNYVKTKREITGE